MFDFIEGPVESKKIQYVVINVTGIGYRIEIPLSCAEKVQAGKRIRLYIHSVIREDSHTLYGFLTQEEREIFEALIRVSGIGPKVGMNILGTFSTGELILILKEKRTEALLRVPNVGGKMAKRLINELSDSSVFSAPGEGDVVAYQAKRALIALGYKSGEAEKVIERIKKPDADLEQLVRLALKDLSKTT